ncbi:MAG: FAD-dependent thymidylate synthase [Planctomycetes bacterium]|nr:FAD-dependent thymidylate synthase [Planctomycetota bacterium]NOG55159.1 FAD-dependent thymidylate synthase [Planctomycetota bacterium]
MTSQPHAANSAPTSARTPAIKQPPVEVQCTEPDPAPELTVTLPHASGPTPVRMVRDATNTSTPDTPMVDVMRGANRWEVPIHEHGFIALIDCMPRLVPAASSDDDSPPPIGADGAIVQAARVSYGQGTKRINEDRGLIRYLLRHRHTTPFEMVEFKFHVSMPIFVARQWIRHRTASVNEYSGRYSVIRDRFYHPTAENVRQQSMSNRQGGKEPIETGTAEQFLEYLDKAEALYNEYEKLADQGVARELARCGLPVSVYTEWYWKCDLHNILHFLSLRMDEHAQAEIRDYAYAMFGLLEPICPITMEAFQDYRLESMHLTRLEIEALRQGRTEIAGNNKREQREWEAKRRRLGLE